MSYFCHIYYCTKKKEENQKELSKRLLTYGFWHSFGISYEESMIERRSNGKPYYIGNENEIFFNLSHGQELHTKRVGMAATVGAKRIGFFAPLDIERKLYENDRQRIFHSTGNDWIYTG